MNCFQHLPESRGAIAQPPRGGATKKKADPTTQHALIGFKHPHLPQPSALHNRTCPCPLTSDRTRNARAPTSPRSIGFCAIWDCISSSSSSVGGAARPARSAGLGRSGCARHSFLVGASRLACPAHPRGGCRERRGRAPPLVEGPRACTRTGPWQSKTSQDWGLLFFEIMGNSQNSQMKRGWCLATRRELSFQAQQSA